MGRGLGVFVGAVLALTAGLGSGAAFAYWTTGGTGTGTALTATPQSVTLVGATGNVSTKLVPGGTADLLIRLSNPNSFPVTITGIEPNGEASGPGGTCTVTGVSVPQRSGLTLTVAAGDTADVHVTDGAAMSAASSSGCQGATFRIPVIVTVRS
jgi:hypothetical protein